MTTTPQQWWLRALLVSAFYLVAGVTAAALAGRAGASPFRIVWRFAFFISSAVVFAGHVRYELQRLRVTRFNGSLHAAIAVALGAFGLALVANVHSLLGPSPSSSPRLLHSALVVWPVVTGAAAFIVALAVARIAVPPR